MICFVQKTCRGGESTFCALNSASRYSLQAPSGANNLHQEGTVGQN